MNHLRHLRYIDEIARCGSIRLAAERLHVAASAVNRRLLDIEDELGTPVFERLPRGMRLTAAGELFIQYVRERGAARPPKVIAATVLVVGDSGEGKIKTSAKSAAGSASVPGDSA